MDVPKPVEPIEICFSDFKQLESEFSANLKNGGLFISGVSGYAERQPVELALVHPVNQATLPLRANVVWVDPTRGGIGVALTGFGAPLREKLAAFIEDNRTEGVREASEEPEWVLEVIMSNAPAPVAQVLAESPPELQSESEPVWELEVIHSNAPEPVALAEPESQPELEPEPEPEQESGQEPIETDDEKEIPGVQNLQERLRRLNPAEQVKVARSGTAHERIALERIYGKAVWDALLQNSSLTLPEVARIARMGSLPMSLVENIVNNPAWLSGPQVRRALLTNPRLRRDLITKVLNSMPQSELRLVPKQTSYPSTIREEAKKLLSRA